MISFSTVKADKRKNIDVCQNKMIYFLCFSVAAATNIQNHVSHLGPQNAITLHRYCMHDKKNFVEICSKSNNS